MRENLCYKSTALQMLGITDAMFQLLGIHPVKKVVNPHFRSGAVAYLYNKDQIQQLVGSSEVEALKTIPRKPKDHGPVFTKRYKTEVDALGAGCNALFNLNRYCKHPECSKKNRDDIYGLKNRFIQLLYTKGFCSSAHVHQRVREAYGVVCYRCDGYGCERCDNTGVYVLPERRMEYIVFHFQVNGSNFVWHQPQASVIFHVETTQAAGELNETEVKPLTIPKAKLSESKALIRWVLDLNTDKL